MSCDTKTTTCEEHTHISITRGYDTNTPIAIASHIFEFKRHDRDPTHSVWRPANMFCSKGEAFI